jgi:hypothetical protein
MRLFRLFIASACALSASAQAQVRTIPDQAKQGEIRHVQEAIVSIDGVQQRLAPGAQIRDESNRLVVPTAVPAGAQVKYLLNDEGQVRQVWILTPAEAAKREKKNEALKN